MRCFIADAPARAFALGHVGHNARVPCSKCWVTRDYISRGIMALRGTEHRPRTSVENFQRIDGEHFNEGSCPIKRLQLDLSKQVVFEYMHLSCIGVMDKIIQFLIESKYASPAKISASIIKMLSNRLQKIAEYCPDEFARKPIDVSKHSDWKATELRQIILYSGAASFFGLINPDVYIHFLLFHCAMRIFIDPCSTPEDILFAENLIKIFVGRAEEIYGVRFMTYNVHGLLHLADDVKAFGPLDSYSAFPFENNMMYFQKCCKKTSQHL